MPWILLSIEQTSILDEDYIHASMPGVCRIPVNALKSPTHALTMTAWVQGKSQD